MIILPGLPGGVGVSFATHSLESRALCVEFLEDFCSLLETKWCESKNFDVVFRGGVGGDIHIRHRVESARPVEVDFRFVVSIHTDNSNFAILYNTRRDGFDETLVPFVGSRGGRVDNEELAEDEWLGFHILLDFRVRYTFQYFLRDFIVEQSEPDNLAIIIECNTGAAAVLEDVLMDELVCVDVSRLEE